MINRPKTQTAERVSLITPRDELDAKTSEKSACVIPPPV